MIHSIAYALQSVVFAADAGDSRYALHAVCVDEHGFTATDGKQLAHYADPEVASMFAPGLYLAADCGKVSAGSKAKGGRVEGNKISWTVGQKQKEQTLTVVEGRFPRYADILSRPGWPAATITVAKPSKLLEELQSSLDCSRFRLSIGAMGVQVSRPMCTWANAAVEGSGQIDLNLGLLADWLARIHGPAVVQVWDDGRPIIGKCGKSTYALMPMRD